MTSDPVLPKGNPKTTEDYIDALMAIHPKGFDLSLDRILGLLEKFDNPQNRLPPVIHVAGTNGKGSAIAFTRSILEAAGLAVHVHTSPHLVNWHERYRIGQKDGPGQLVEDTILANAIARVWEANGGDAITVFEMLTVVAFLLFSEHPADACLMEVGLGGRFDSTNVMEQVAVSVITPVSIDHEAYLGDTLAKIAFEKAGIIKRDTPVVVGPQEDEALAVIEHQAARNGAKLIANGQQFHAGLENGRMIYQDETALLDLDLPHLPGDHQISNAATAIAACRTFAQSAGMTIDEDAVNNGLANVSWPGRMQRVQEGALLDALPNNTELWLDGGHNPGAAVMVSNFMRDLQIKDGKELVLICGMLNTKDPGGYLEAFSGLAGKVITVPILSSDAGIDEQELAEFAKNCALDALSAAGLQQALSHIVTPDQRVLIAGSLYLVGDALEQNKTPPT